MSLEFYNRIKEHAETTPDKSAIIDGDITLSYSQLLESVERFAEALEKLDPNPDSKLGILCLNQKEYLIAYLGALLKGLPAVPMNFLLDPEDLAFIAQDAGIDLLVVDGVFVKPEASQFFKLFRHKILTGSCASPEPLGTGAVTFEDFLRAGDPLSAADPLSATDRKAGMRRHARAAGIPDVLLYTSGTTARPKGVMLEESQFYLNTDGFQSCLGFTADERVIVALPLFHSFGNIMALVILRLGGALILLRQFAPKTILATIGRQKATILPLVPTIYSFLVDLCARGGYDVSSLRLCVSGGSSLPEALLHKVEKTLGVVVIEGYGLTETSPVISVNKTAEGSVPGSVGYVLPNVEVKIVDESENPVPQGSIGEILARGPTMMRGYWKRPRETAETLTADGWLKTGDLGHMDAKGRLYISAGRKKDLIIRAGENISPLAIENAMMNHPAVAEAAAVGIPHPRMGEQVKLCVALRQGSAATEMEIKEFCRARLPAYITPDIVRFYETLPKTSTGKILKTQLKEN